MIPLNAFLLDALMENVKPGPCNAIARVLRTHAAGAIVVTTLELPITRSDRSKLDCATIFQFPGNGTSWGGPLQGLIYAVSKMLNQMCS